MASIVNLLENSRQRSGSVRRIERIEHAQMRRPFELQIAVIERHLIILPADLLANLPWRNDELGAHRQRRDLHLASEVEIVHQTECFGDRSTDRQQAMISQDERRKNFRDRG